MIEAAKWLLAIVIVVGWVGYARAADVPAAQSTSAPAGDGAAAKDFDIAKGSIVSLQFKRAPAYEVYESLYRQAGATVQPDKKDHLWDELAKKPVTIDVKNVSFWEAIDALEEQTDLSVSSFPTQSELTEINRGERGEICYHGAFKLVAVEAGGPGRYQMLNVFAEPRIRLLSHARDATITEALDVLGEKVALQPMNPPGAGAGNKPDMEDSLPGGAAFDVFLPSDPDSRRLKSLKGSIRVMILADTRQVEIAGISKKNNIEHKEFGRRFVVGTLQPAPGEYTISVAAFNTDPPTPGLMRLSPALLDAQGKAYESGGSTAGGDGVRRLDFNFQFHNPGGLGPAEKLVLKFPGQTRELDLPFAFGKPRKEP